MAFNVNTAFTFPGASRHVVYTPLGGEAAVKKRKKTKEKTTPKHQRICIALPCKLFETLPEKNAATESPRGPTLHCTNSHVYTYFTYRECTPYLFCTSDAQKAYKTLQTQAAII